MKIALVISLGGDLVRSTEHLGIAYIAAILREHSYQVDIYEIEEKNIVHKSTYDNLLHNNYDIVGFTTTCITMKNIIAISAIIKEESPSSYILYGGHMATFTGAKLLEEFQNVDFSIIGEGENTFLELVRCLENKGDLATVKGLIYRNAGKVCVNEGRELIENLDLLPFPVRDQFERYGSKAQYIRISTSRGCLGSCGFCSNFVGRKQKGARWRGRSPINVVDEIETLVNKYSFRTFDFVDSTFEDPGKEGKERIRQIAQEILNRNLTIFYNCCFRAENWSLEDSDLLELLCKSGLEKVNIGFEAGNNRGLKLLNKNAVLDDNYQVIHILKKYPQIYLTFGFIMLHPYSNLQDIKDNADFLHNTGFGQVIRHYFWRLEVYPGTLFEFNLQRDKLLDKSYNIDDGMYKYHFQNREVAFLEPIFENMLSLKSVWDFEIFDILVHTFITRLQKKYKSEPVVERINEFSEFVKKIRLEMTDFNYLFFLSILEEGQNCDIEQKKADLNNYILDKMHNIKKRQYLLGKELTRQGFKLDIK